ncbi:MAG: YgiT-type zinc finger protein [Euryarchaeota archaeon]|nr:YgiT-type zinc finger protein [Euryarchaeota archaeon]
MKKNELAKGAPMLTDERLEQARKMILATSKAPLLPTGTTTTCPVCKGPMVTTNDLQRVLAVPHGVVVLTRLPGAVCTRCGAKAYDAAAVALTLEHSGSEIIADYETKVTRASGGTLGTYFKADLSRVLRLTGKERLRWKVLDKDQALVEVER